MKTLELLIVSAQTAFIDAVSEGADKKRFNITTVSSEEGAIEKYCQANFDVVIAGNDLSGEAIRKLKAVFKTSPTDAVVIHPEENKPFDIQQSLREIFLSKQRESLQHIAVNDTLDAKNLESQINLVK